MGSIELLTLNGEVESFLDPILRLRFTKIYNATNSLARFYSKNYFSQLQNALIFS
jgi:hypothetical protein